MTFVLTLELVPGETYADISKHISKVANALRHGHMKPEHPEEIDVTAGRNGSQVKIGTWKLTNGVSRGKAA